MRYPTVLTIAGSDSCGGAGIQADIKTISSLGVYACSAITAITSQNTTGVRSIQGIDPNILKDQIEAVFEDMKIDAVKSGMLYSKDSVEAIADCLKRFSPKYYVLDPVMVSTSGSKLITDEAIEAVREMLFPLATLITPNIEEVRVLTGISVKSVDDMQRAAEALLDCGCNAVLMKGGHLDGDESVDMLFEKGKKDNHFFIKNITHTFKNVIKSIIGIVYVKKFCCLRNFTYLCRRFKRGRRGFPYRSSNRESMQCVLYDED